MPKPIYKTNKLVTCPNCKKQQTDEGRRTTCSGCGFQPIPSYSYKKSNAFHPDCQKKFTKKKVA